MNNNNILKMEENDHYKTLEINRQATQKQVKKAYLRLCKIHHPDKNRTQDTAEFQRVSKAYVVLSNTDRRRQYDVVTFKKQFKTPVKGVYTDSFRKVRIPHTKILKILSLKQVYLRQDIPFSFKRTTECETCRGFGSTGFETCKTCKGEKWVCQGFSSLAEADMFINCLTCGGKGMVLSVSSSSSPPQLKKRKTSAAAQNPVDDLKCTSCQGQGTTTEDVSITCPFPKDFYDGKTEIFKEQGDRRINASAAGSVMIKLIVEPTHGNFYFEGDGDTRLRYFQYLSLSEALAGNAGQLTTIDGRIIPIERKKTRGSIRHGEEFWIRHEGLWKRKYSWLRVVFQIKPPSFSTAQIQTIRTWEKSIENHWSAFCGRSG